MKNSSQLFAVFVGILLLSSCTTTDKLTTKRPVLNATDTIVGAPKVHGDKDAYDSLPYRPVATKTWELDTTELAISFNFKSRTADAIAKIQLHPYYYATDEIVLDAKGMKIHYVVADYNFYYDEKRFNKIIDTIPFEYDGKQLKIKLQQPQESNQYVKLTIAYTAQPYLSESISGQAIRGNRGLYFVNTNGYEPYQPVQVWTQGETESNSRWFPTFDHTNFRSVFKILMTVPDSFKTLSNGALIKSERHANGMRTDKWLQQVPIPPYLVMMAVGKFSITMDKPWKSIPVEYYVPEEYGVYAKDIFRNTPEMIDFFSKKLKVDYPWNKYSQVITYDYVSGAMENVSASLFGAFNLKDKRSVEDDPNDFIVAHELFHQWFGDYVTAESWSQLTLNESFADFGEKLWTEYKYGYEERQIRFYNSKLRYLAQTPKSDFPLIRYRYASSDDVFDRVTYSKGGLILNYLRRLTGDAAFFKSLNTYLTENALHSAEVEQLRIAFEKTTGQDWNWFFEQWYHKGGHPILSVEYIYDDAHQKLVVKSIQTQPAKPYQTQVYRLPLKAHIVCGNRLKITNWLVDSIENTLTIPYENEVRPLFIPDAENCLPGVIVESKTFNQWEQQYLAGLSDLLADEEINGTELNKIDVMSRHKALLNLSEMKAKNASLATDSIFRVAIEKDPSAFIRLTAINLFINSGVKGTEENKEFFYHMAQKEKDNKALSAVVFWLGLQKEQRYKDFFESRTGDNSYYVAKEALRALDGLNHHRAESIARELMEQNRWSADWLAVALGIIAQNGDGKDFRLFNDIIWKKFEGDRNKLIPIFIKYLESVKDDRAYLSGLQTIQKLALKTPDYIQSRVSFLHQLAKLSETMQRRAKAAVDEASKNFYDFRTTAAGNTSAGLLKDLNEEQRRQISEELKTYK